MDFLRKLFGGGGGRVTRGQGGDNGLYFYVKCDRCGEVIRVRINPMSELSQSEDGRGTFTRKLITGKRCYNRIEAVFYFDGGKRLRSSDISGATLSDEAAYRADQAAHPPET